jgi:hypothetical protein
MDLGRDFATWKIMKTDTNDPAIPRIVESYSSYVDQYITHVTVGQLNKGLDDFYGDYKNLRIQISDAVWPVLKGISGDSKEQIEGLIENLRKNAAHN